MSTILKALRRLEEERTAKTERALREQVVGSAPHAPRNWRQADSSSGVRGAKSSSK